MTWGKFERFALDGPGREWVGALLWPQFIAALIYVMIEPLRRRFYPLAVHALQRSPK